MGLLEKLIDRYYRLRLNGVAYARRMGVTVGKNCRVLTNVFGSEPFLISIGDGTTISSEVLFVNHDGALSLAKDERGRRFEYFRITIGKNCFIGARSILMPGVNIGDNCIVAAGAIVTKSLPEGVIVGGNPARVLGRTADFIAKGMSAPAEADLPSRNDYPTWVAAALSNREKPLLNPR